MVGSGINSPFEILLGCRVKVNQNAGTVRYIGEVKGHSDLWVGVEWDDPRRGKHNGIIDGVKYFETVEPTSGSMVRMSKLNPFESLENAILDRYARSGDNVLDENLVREAQEYCGASLFQIVGLQEIARQQSRVEWHTDVSVANSNTSYVGNVCCLKRLRILDLSSTLIWNWNTIADIAQQVPTLESINLSSNRIQLPAEPDINQLEPCFRNLKHINLNKCGISRWNDITLLAKLWPMILSLSLEGNLLQFIAEPNTAIIFKALEELNLNFNKLSSFDEICKLSNIDSLKSLHIMGNGIKTISFGPISFNEKLDIFRRMVKLNIKENSLLEEVYLFNELDKLPSLKELNISIRDGSHYEDTFSIAVGLVQDLQVFNKIHLTKENRRGAEYDVWKKFAPEWRKCENDPSLKQKFFCECRAYPNLVESYGSPVVYFNTSIMKSSSLIKIKVENSQTGEYFEKRVPRKMSVQALQGLIIKFFKKENTMPSLKYVDSNHSDLIVELDNSSKSLDYYSVQDGDTILCRW